GSSRSAPIRTRSPSYPSSRRVTAAVPPASDAPTMTIGGRFIHTSFAVVPMRSPYQGNCSTARARRDVVRSRATSPRLLDDVVGANQHRLRNRGAKAPHRLQVDREIELGRLLHR